MSAQPETTGHGLESLGELTKDLNLPHHEDTPAPVSAATDKPSGDVVHIKHHQGGTRKPSHTPRPAPQQREPIARRPNPGERDDRPRMLITLDQFCAEDDSLLVQKIREIMECDALPFFVLRTETFDVKGKLDFKTQLDFKLRLKPGRKGECERVELELVSGHGFFASAFGYNWGLKFFRDEIFGTREVPEEFMLVRGYQTSGLGGFIKFVQSKLDARAHVQATVKAE